MPSVLLLVNPPSPFLINPIAFPPLGMLYVAASVEEAGHAVEVVDLWPNRLIGDEQLPEDSERNPDGTLKRWPQWVLDGKPSPTGRHTFTSWRLWRKTDQPLKSGLIGPVTLQSTTEVRLR